MANRGASFNVAGCVGVLALLLGVACSGSSGDSPPPTSVEGTLVQMIGRGTEGDVRTSYFLKTKSGMTRLHAAAGYLERLTPNSRVSVRGSWSAHQELIVDDIKPLTRVGEITQSLSSAAPKGKVAILLIKDSGVPEPYTKQAVIDEILSADNPRSTNSFFQQVSSGEMELSGDVFGWYSVAMPTCEQGGGAAIVSQVEQLAAQQDGFVTDDYRHAIYLFQPSGPNCALAFGSLGSPDGVGQVWSWANDANVMAHEIGHNLGLHHANSLSCEGSAFEPVTYSAHCRSNEYLDPWDGMGFQGFYHHFNSYSKQLQGWVPTAQRARATSAGSFTLVPHGSEVTGGIQSLLVPIPNTNQAYHVEMRKELAPFDEGPLFDGAVLVRRVAEPGYHVQSNLIDMTPDSDISNAPLEVGQAFTDPQSGIAITLTSRSEDESVIDVAFDAPRCGDGLQNGSETGLDCGGLCGPCADGQQCVTNRDCSGHACVEGLCVASEGGLRGEYFAGSEFDQSVAVRIDQGIDFEWGTGSPLPELQSDFFTVRWTGKLVPPTTGPYQFRVNSDDGARLWLDGQQIIARWEDGDVTVFSDTVQLTSGQEYDIRLEYREQGDRARVTLAWDPPTTPLDVIPPTALIPAESTDCSLANALDLGPPTVLTTVPSNACVKVSQYPSWWVWTNGLVTLQSANGSFPVPATWTDVCTQASADVTFTTPWQSQPIGNHTSTCPVLIQLNGDGSQLQLKWW